MSQNITIARFSFKYIDNKDMDEKERHRLYYLYK